MEGEGYVYIEYPKSLYNDSGATMVVDNREEEDGARAFSWMSAEEFHNPNRIIVPPSNPFSKSPEKTDEELEEERELEKFRLELEEVERLDKEKGNDDSQGSDT